MPELNLNPLIRPCVKCGATDRYGNTCKPCKKARDAARYAENPGKNKAAKAAWNASNPDKVKAIDAAWKARNADKIKTAKSAYRVLNSAKANARTEAWRIANPEKENAGNAAYRALNSAKIRAGNAAWRAANPDKAKASTAAWRSANPESIKINNQNRRALKKTVGGKLSKGLAAKLIKLQKGKCPCCAQPLGDNYHLDHRMPLALGGVNEDWNMQLLRSTCNLQKHAKHPVDFMQEKGFLL